MAGLVFSGALVFGKGEGTRFTRTDWVRAAFQSLVAIDPWPGTLNLRVSEKRSLAVWHEIKNMPGLILRAPDPAWCDGRCYPAVIQGIASAIVIPEVASYPPDQVEIVAAVSIRETLGVGDGDLIEVEVTA